MSVNHQIYDRSIIAMTQFSIGAIEMNERRESNFAEFVSITKGRSIVSAADWGNGRIELGLSGGAMLRFFGPPSNDAEINLIATVNRDELPPLLISLGDMPQQVSLAIVERKLRGLRTLYAIFFLYHTDRLDDLLHFLETYPEGDIEQNLLSEEDALNIESISYGSWVLAVWAKTKASYKAISSVAGLAFDRGREAFIEKMEAGARLAQAKARREEIAADKDEFQLKKSQLDYMLKISGKVESPQLRANLESIMINATRNLTSGDPNDAGSYKQLSNSNSPRSKP
jgi:hypothetical protein